MNVRLKSIIAAGVLTAPLIVIAGATQASATACTSPVKYSSSTNTIYLVTPQAFTLSDIKSFCQSAPLSLVDPANKIWELSADLVVQNGASLVLHGNGAQAGGDVNTLRLRSLANNLATDVQSITAKWGTIDADSTTVTSWDDATKAPDTDTTLPAGAPSASEGRAFVRAISYFDTSNTPHQSTMNIVNSTFSYLGWYASESYGVAYKAESCDHTHLDLCAQLPVTGKETGSRFLNNYMGTYTWGASDMQFTNNEYGHNIMYGLDPHDVSRNLDIEYNHFHDNGDHGVICSQKCDHLTIEHNESDHNGVVPWTGPNGDAADGQVHGIMLHRGVTNTTVAYNYVHDQPTGAGIAIFDTSNDSIHDNTVTAAKYGLRLSVGSAGNNFVDNTVTASGQYAVFMYKGSDAPENSTASGHPTANVFAGNTFDGTKSNQVKTTEADNSTFTDNRFVNASGSILLQQSVGTTFGGNSFNTNQLFNLVGSSTEPSSVRFTTLATPVKVSVDKYSQADFVDSSGGLFMAGTSTNAKTTVTSAGSDLAVTSAAVGTSAVAVAAQPAAVVPGSGSAAATVKIVAGLPQITIYGTVAGQSLAISVKQLSPGTDYAVNRGAAYLGTFTTDGSGLLTFTDTPGATSSIVYSLTKV